MTQLYLDQSPSINTRINDFLLKIDEFTAAVNADKALTNEILSKLPLLLTETGDVTFNLDTALTIPSIQKMKAELTTQYADLDDQFVQLESFVSNKISEIEANTSTNSTQTTQIAAIQQTLSLILPIGTVTSYASAIEPAGWLFCDGRAISRTLYADLFVALNIDHGAGDGIYTFNIPDLRGIFVKGAGIGTKTAADGTMLSGLLGVYENDMFQGHRHIAVNHPDYRSKTDPTSPVYLWGLSPDDNYSESANNRFGSGKPLSDGTNGAPRTGNRTQPANIALNYIIFTGVFS